MRQPARHRLLLLLSDGKPNDVDDYEGRYGVEDMRQAVTEARLQGIIPFCLTVDRQAANYLPGDLRPAPVRAAAAARAAARRAAGLDEAADAELASRRTEE